MAASYFDLTGKTPSSPAAARDWVSRWRYALAEAGADVALVARTQADLDKAAAEVRAATVAR